MSKFSPWKGDFSVFSHPDYVDLHYLDTAATCLMPEVVADAIYQYQRCFQANSHRGLYQLSANATELVEDARENVAQFINAPSGQNIVFTSGTTETINMIAHSFIKSNINSTHNIIISATEHHANLLPWQRLCEQSGAQLRIAPLTSSGDIDLTALSQLIDEMTYLVAVTHVSNVLGRKSSIKKIGQLAHNYGSLVLVDGAQAVGHFSVDVTELDCDFYVFSAHKMYGPSGCGVLYGKTKCLDNVEPYNLGGGIVNQVSYENYQCINGPLSLEVGTRNVAGIVGLSAAIDYLRGQTWTLIEKHIEDVSTYLYEQLLDLPFIHPVINSGESTNIFSFQMDKVHCHDVASLLDQSNIAVRAGHHCAQPLHKLLGIKSSVRVSLGLYNSKKDIDYLVTALKETHQILALG